MGDIKTNEIARLELGLKHHSLEKKTTGYISGSNVTDNIKILREETNATYDDIRDFCVSRRERWKQLMKKHYGKIDVEIAKRMLADHYDVYLQREAPSSRTICGHAELDGGSIPGGWGALIIQEEPSMEKLLTQIWRRIGSFGQNGEAPATLVSMRSSF